MDTLLQNRIFLKIFVLKGCYFEKVSYFCISIIKERHDRDIRADHRHRPHLEGKDGWQGEIRAIVRCQVAQAHHPSRRGEQVPVGEPRQSWHGLARGMRALPRHDAADRGRGEPAAEGRWQTLHLREQPPIGRRGRSGPRSIHRKALRRQFQIPGE